jgi:hypothetical protein
MTRGTLRLSGGKLNSFSWVANGGGLSMFWMKLEFEGVLDSMIHVTGGVVAFMEVSMHDQLDTNWVSALINASATSDYISVQILFSTITNCTYKYDYTEPAACRASSVVCFRDDSNSLYTIVFKMSYSSFRNNTFDLNGDNRGGVCEFYSNNLDSGMLNFLLVFLFCGINSPSFLFYSLLFSLFFFSMFSFSIILLFSYFLFVFTLSVFSVEKCVFSNITQHTWVGGFLFFFF